MSSKYWSIAVDAPMLSSLTYAEPEFLQNQIQPGQLVVVPLGKRKVEGLILKQVENLEDSKFQIKEIEAKVEIYEPISKEMIQWLEWLSDYYCHPVGQVTKLVFPPLKPKTRKSKIEKPPVVNAQSFRSPPQLTLEQKKCVDGISAKINQFSVHLLFGVTGSGKTEVYLRLLDEVLKSGKTGLMLVPEIALTPQLTDRFSSRFGDQIAVLHSQLTERDKTNQWWEIVQGKKKVLIGARSALFCPMPNLGMIVVDEEHENSFKQDEKLKYNGRDAAIMLGKILNIPVVLGSATPSLESWKNALEKKYDLHQMQERVENRSLPTVTVVDLKNIEIAEEQKKLNIPNWLSPLLFEKIQNTLEKKEQVALFLNRRGLAHIVLCPDCGFVKECPNCDISLTLHHQTHMICHYCDYTETFKSKCPDCATGELTPVGLGTEKIENEIQKLFPTAIVARADRDEITNREELEDMIRQMENHEIDILVGTQMIAKGLDFPKLTLVGLVLADVSFNLPDFRASEKSFQLMTQVSGRSGRHIRAGESPGEVVIQTYNPDHVSIEFAKTAQFAGFAEQELQARQALMYPPYGKLISVRIQSIDQRKAEQTAQLFAERGHHLKTKYENYRHIEVLGPAEAPLAKLRGKYRFQILLKGPNAKIINQFAKQCLSDESWVPNQVRIMLDVDPIALL